MGGNNLNQIFFFEKEKRGEERRGEERRGEERRGEEDRTGEETATTRQRLTQEVLSLSGPVGRRNEFYSSTAPCSGEKLRLIAIARERRWFRHPRWLLVVVVEGLGRWSSCSESLLTIFWARLISCATSFTRNCG
jgi:hypothetical protein